MVVRDDIAVGRHDDAGAGGLAGLGHADDGHDAPAAAAVDLLQAERPRVLRRARRHARGRGRDLQLRQLRLGLRLHRSLRCRRGAFRGGCLLLRGGLRVGRLHIGAFGGLLPADGQQEAAVRAVERHAHVPHQMHRPDAGQHQQRKDHDRRDPAAGVPAPPVFHRRRLRLPVLCGIVVIEAVIVKAHIRHLLA